MALTKCYDTISNENPSFGTKMRLVYIKKLNLALTNQNHQNLTHLTNTSN